MLRTLALLAFLSPLACSTLEATRLRGPSTLDEALGLYAATEEKKAFALAVDEDGTRAWGVFYPAKLQGFANEEALKVCERNARRSGVYAPCHLFAEGNAHARATLDGCRNGTIGRRRCDAQHRYGPFLTQ